MRWSRQEGIVQIEGDGDLIQCKVVEIRKGGWLQAVLHTKCTESEDGIYTGNESMLRMATRLGLESLDEWSSHFI